MIPPANDQHLLNTQRNRYLSHMVEPLSFNYSDFPHHFDVLNVEKTTLLFYTSFIMLQLSLLPNARLSSGRSDRCRSLHGISR